MPEFRVVLDTNIYVSAILFGGIPEQVLGLARRKVMKIYISQEILDEVLKVLKIKFDWRPDQLSEAEAEIKSLAFKVTPRRKIEVVKEDPEDNKVIEAAVEAKAQLIISGDKHLLGLKTYENVNIITTREFLKLL